MQLVRDDGAAVADQELNRPDEPGATSHSRVRRFPPAGRTAVALCPEDDLGGRPRVVGREVDFNGDACWKLPP